MTMIKQFFKQLNQQVKTAKTIRALNLLIKRNKKFVNDIIYNPILAEKIKKQAIIESKKSSIIISKQFKKIN